MSNDDVPAYPVSREMLHEMAWSEPMTNIAQKFSISSSYLVRVYTLLNVPRPSPGDWAKIAAGHSVKVPELPPANPENERGWDRHNDSGLPLAAKLLRASPPRKKSRRPPVKGESHEIHPLIQGAAVSFLKS